MFVAIIAALTRLFRAAEADSQDFHVYYRAVNSWWNGTFPYLIDPTDRGFVFKYPPWMLPLFLPFTWLGYEFSKAIWAAIETATLAYTVVWLIRSGVSRTIALVTLGLFWYIWLAHYFAGQFTLILLFVGLWAVSPGRREKPFAGALLSSLFGSKVFSGYTLFGDWRRLLKPQVIGGALFLVAAAHVFLLLEAHRAGVGYFSELSHLYEGFRLAAASGGAELGAEVVRGTGNHGFPAMALRVLDPQAHSTSADIAVSVVFALSLGAIWSRVSRDLRFEERWSGWLALGVVAHPLAWHHSFVMAFPLCSYALQAAIEVPRGHRSRRLLIIAALLGIAFIGLLVPQVVGKTIVKPFELLANKSWGALLCAWTLLRAREELAQPSRVAMPRGART